MKLKEKFKAVRLRKAGHSYSDILKHINVSKSTLSLWLRNVELSSRQEYNLLISREKSQYIAAQAKKEKRIQKTNAIIYASKKEFTKFLSIPLFLAGLMLYTAEGDKHKGERVKFTNSDPALIALMMKWFREICHVPEDKFRIALHIHNLQIRDNPRRYWMKITGITENQFHKLYVKKSSLHQRRNVLYNGTCGIVVNNKDLFRKILGWKLGMLNYFNISP